MPCLARRESVRRRSLVSHMVERERERETTMSVQLNGSEFIAARILSREYEEMIGLCAALLTRIVLHPGKTAEFHLFDRVWQAAGVLAPLATVGGGFRVG